MPATQFWSKSTIITDASNINTLTELRSFRYNVVISSDAVNESWKFDLSKCRVSCGETFTEILINIWIDFAAFMTNVLYFHIAFSCIEIAVFFYLCVSWNLAWKISTVYTAYLNIILMKGRIEMFNTICFLNGFNFRIAYWFF